MTSAVAAPPAGPRGEHQAPISSCACFVGGQAEELPRFVSPMLLRPGPPPVDDSWVVEVKFDACARLCYDGRRLCIRAVAVKVDFHGPPSGPVRDPLLKAIRGSKVLGKAK